MTEEQLEYLHTLLDKKMWALNKKQKRQMFKYQWDSEKKTKDEIRFVQSIRHDLLFVEPDMDNYDPL
tara:strand:+ start:279 stop:479 length:201 start_codon:yes stop_codon:yes gene_type:complete